MSEEYKLYRKKGTAEMRPYVPGEDLTGVEVPPGETAQDGGMISRNPDNHPDCHYVPEHFFKVEWELAE